MPQNSAEKEDPPEVLVSFKKITPEITSLHFINCNKIIPTKQTSFLKGFLHEAGVSVQDQYLQNSHWKCAWGIHDTEELWRACLMEEGDREVTGISTFNASFYLLLGCISFKWKDVTLETSPNATDQWNACTCVQMTFLRKEKFFQLV